MAYAHARLTEITTLPNSAGAVFTQPSGKTSYIRIIHIHNSNTTAESVKLYKVPDSGGSVGSAGATNEIYAETIEGGGTRVLEYPAQGLILKDQNETIQGVTTTASKVTIEINGGQE